MAQYPMTQVIAKREVDFTSPDGTVKVLASLGMPAPLPASTRGDWYCPWLIEGPDRSRQMSAVGVDALQALLMAISGMRADLQLIASKGRLTFLGHEDLGIALVGSA